MPSLANSLAGPSGTTSNITNSSTVSGATLTNALDTLKGGVDANTAAIALKADKAWTVRTVTGTSDTTLSADAGNPVLCTNAGAVAISVPSGLPLGVYPYFFMGGAATQGTFTGTGGLTVTAPSGFVAKSRVGGSGAMVAINVLSSTVAVISGDLSTT